MLRKKGKIGKFIDVIHILFEDESKEVHKALAENIKEILEEVKLSAEFIDEEETKCRVPTVGFVKKVSSKKTPTL
jgi:hypothetical protein